MKILFVLGLAFMTLAAWLAMRAHRRILASRLVDGRVAELIPVRGSKGGTNYKLRIAFKDPGGMESSFVTAFSSKPPMHDLGEAVKVGLAPGEAPLLVSFPARFAFPWILFLIGALMSVLPLGFWYGPGWMRSHYYPFG
jgi:hypothetical protein